MIPLAVAFAFCRVGSFPVLGGAFGSSAFGLGALATLASVLIAVGAAAAAAATAGAAPAPAPAAAASSPVLAIFAASPPAALASGAPASVGLAGPAALPALPALPATRPPPFVLLVVAVSPVRAPAAFPAPLSALFVFVLGGGACALLSVSAARSVSVLGASVSTLRLCPRSLAVARLGVFFLLAVRLLLLLLLLPVFLFAVIGFLLLLVRISLLAPRPIFPVATFILVTLLFAFGASPLLSAFGAPALFSASTFRFGPFLFLLLALLLPGIFLAFGSPRFGFLVLFPLVCVLALGTGGAALSPLRVRAGGLLLVLAHVASGKRQHKSNHLEKKEEDVHEVS